MDNTASTPQQSPPPVLVEQNQMQQQPVPPQNPASGTSKLPMTITVVVVVLLIMIGAVYLINRSVPNVNNQGQKNITINPTPTATGAKIEPTKEDMSTQDTSDAQIEKDMQGVDASAEATNSDLTGVSDGLNDQSVNLSE